jgi:glycosyltransferase involved in cell wall biosynthesis
MKRPLVTVVVDTITARTGLQEGALADLLAGPMAALARQTLPAQDIEIVVVIDADVPESERAQVTGRYARVRLAESASINYFDGKNSGARAARADFVTFLDGDCTPEPDWLERLVARFGPDVDAVAGCVRYSGDSWSARTFSVPDFAYILTEDDGQASGFNLGNVAFRRSLLEELPLEARIRRNGGCYLLFHQIRRRGGRVLYEPRARVAHALDFAGIGFIGKHYQRGYDSVDVYRYDRDRSLRGTRLFQRFGAAALVAFTGRRILIDWARLARHHRQMGVATLAVPYYAAVGAGLRVVELAGSVAASLRGYDRAAGST